MALGQHFRRERVAVEVKDRRVFTVLDFERLVAAYTACACQVPAGWQRGHRRAGLGDQQSKRTKARSVPLP
jgi:hypothetical protein